MQIRKAIFAGNWYPGDAAGCQREIETFLEEGKQRAMDFHIPAYVALALILRKQLFTFNQKIKMLYILVIEPQKKLH